MKFLSLLIVTLLMMPASVFAQGNGATEASQDVKVQVPTDERPQAKKSYLIELVEFQFNEAPSPSLTAEDMLDRLTKAAEDNGVEVIQTFHLSTVAGQESMAQVERQTAITTGVAYPQGREGPAPPIRNLQQTRLGSSLTVTAEPADDQIGVTVRYAASRIAGEKPEDGPPDIVSITLQSQLLVAPGRRVLLGGANGASSSHAALTVAEQ